MASDDGGEKTEDPTGKQLTDARDRGEIAKSPEFMTAALLLGSGLTFNIVGPTLWRFLLEAMGQNIRAMGDQDLRGPGLLAWVQMIGFRTLVAMIGVIGAMAVIAVVVQAIQTGGLLSTKALEPKWERLNPLTNTRQLFSKRSLVELAKSLLKMAIVSWAVYATIRNAWPEIQSLALQSPQALGSVTRKYSLSLMRNAGMMFLGLGLADYGWQRWQTFESLKMTKQQVKDESKSQEGDAEVKGRRRQIARDRIRRTMFANVRKADVVIVNPVHIAIAIKYDPSVAPAPYVVALGQRMIATRIKELAFQHGVPVIENIPLARALFAASKVGTMIPVEMYLAVAEVLAFVLKQRQRFGNSWRGTASA